MLHVVRANLYPAPPYKNYLFWEYGETSESPLNFLVTIERSSAAFENGAENKIIAHDLPGLTQSYVDTDDINYYIEQDYYYRLRIKHKTDPQITEYLSQPFYSSIRTDRIVLTAIHNEELYLEKFVQNKVYLYKKLLTGIKCPFCYDYSRMTTTRSDCPECLNTGIYKGYEGPFEMYMQIRPSPRVESRSYEEISHESQAMGWTVYTVQISPGDVIVDIKRRVPYKVISVAITEWKGAPVKQTAQLLVPEPNDPATPLIEKTIKTVL